MFPNNMGIDIPTEPIPGNYDEVRGKTLSTNKSMSKDTLIFLARLSVVYYERIVHNNSKDDDDPMDSTPELSYETEQERAFHISKVAE